MKRICWCDPFQEEFRFHGFFEIDEVIEQSVAFDGTCKYRRKIVALVENEAGRIGYMSPINVRFKK